MASKPIPTFEAQYGKTRVVGRGAVIALSTILGLVTLGVPLFCYFLGVTGNALLIFAAAGWCLFFLYVCFVTWRLLKSEFPVYEKK